MRLAYLDCSEGIGGDRLIGAGLAAGAAVERIVSVIAGFGGKLETAAIDCGGLQATRACVRFGDTPRPRQTPAPAGALPRGAWPLAQLLERLDHAHLPPTAAARARSAAQAWARAEARVRGVAVEEVRFPRPIAMLAEIAGAVLVLEDLKVDRVQCSPLNTGGFRGRGGSGRWERGASRKEAAARPRLAPAPETLELLRGAPIYATEGAGELVTPLGAALVRTLAQGFGPLPPLRIEAQGFGVGAGSGKDSEQASLLRLIVGVPLGDVARAGAGEDPADEVAVLEANLDDLNPQIHGYVAERALALGALDVFAVAAQMKKNRPGLLLTIVMRPGEEERFARLVLEETTSLGVRIHRARRVTLERRVIEVETQFGAIRVKLASRGDRVLNAAPEYEDCRQAALRAGVPLKLVMQEVLRVLGETRHGREA